ncbi:MAG: hypothetical protein AB7C98_09930 [Acidithiobacillus sp.]
MDTKINAQRLSREILAWATLSVILAVAPILHLQLPSWLLIPAVFFFCFFGFQLFKNTKNERIFDPAVKAAVWDRIKSPERAYRKMSKWNRKLFCGCEQRGAIGINLKVTPNHHAAGRQSGSGGKQSKSKRQSSGSKSSSDDSDGGDGEPPRPLPFYSYKTLAKLLDCSEKTLRNQASAGKLPRPIQTIVGPRFTQEHLQNLIYPTKKSEQNPSIKKRGRPRIIQTQGGAA